MKVEYFAEKEQAIIIERDPAVTAAAEISSNETAYEIIFYNHHIPDVRSRFSNRI